MYKRETSGYNQQDNYNINKQKENQDKINRHWRYTKGEKPDIINKSNTKLIN